MRFQGLLLALALASGSAYGGQLQGQAQGQGQLQGQAQGQGQHQGQHQRARSDAEANAGAIAGAAAGANANNHNRNVSHNRNSQHTDVGVHSANLNLNGAASYSEGSRAASGSYSGDVTSRNRNDSSAYVEGDTFTATAGDQTTSVTTGAFNDGDATFNDGDTAVDAGDVSVTGDTVTSTYREAASTAIAGYGNTTASCFRTLGVGGATRSGSWSLGLPLKDRECALGEDAAAAFMVGNYTLGWKLFCAQGSVKTVYGAKRFNRQSHRDARSTCYNEAMDNMAKQEATQADANAAAERLAALERELQTMKDAEKERRMNEVIGTRADLEALGVVKK